MHLRPKPVELRELRSDFSTTPQGSLRLWLDIITPEVAFQYPPLSIAAPPTRKFQLRVVVWRTTDVMSFDSAAFGSQNDLYAKSWLEGQRPQTTDTHWRSKNGIGSFNWRMVWDVELVPGSRLWKFPYFHLQLWDKDLLKYNDCIGEATVDLTSLFRRAYRRNESINLFAKRKADAKRKQAEASESGRGGGGIFAVASGGNDDENDVVDDDDDDDMMNGLFEMSGFSQARGSA